METHFLNIDLDVRAEAGGLKELTDAFSPALFELGRDGDQHASFEIDAGFKQLSIDEIILAFYNAVQTLSPRARAIWERADSRCFDIGIQSGDAEQVSYLLSPETVGRISSMNAQVKVTIYPLPKY